MPLTPQPRPANPSRPFILDLFLLALNSLVLLSSGALLVIGLVKLYQSGLTETSPAWIHFFLSLALIMAFRRLPI
jgi:hypothetical protein